MFASSIRKLPRRLAAAVTSTLLCLPLGGCFDAEALLETQRSAARLDELQEVDLGKYRISLAQDAENPQIKIAEVFFHAFGRIPYRDLQPARRSLEEHRADFEHQILLAIRELQVEQLEDPELSELRQTILNAVNHTIPGAPIESIGFYSFGFSNF